VTALRPDKPRVLVVDDETGILDTLRILLRNEGFEPHTAHGGKQGLEMLTELAPDVVLTDIRMPPSETDEGIQIAQLLRTSHPGVAVVVLSQFSQPQYALALLRDGSDRRAYMLKERVHNRAELLSAIRTVAAGGSWIDPKVVEVLVAGQAQAEQSLLDELTARELEVLALIAHGASNAAIADDLVLTKRAVEKHINSIFMKLGFVDAADVSKRVKAALVFLAETHSEPSP
jgi:DNA-binding NarL/FixJ family response regulator